MKFIHKVFVTLFSLAFMSAVIFFCSNVEAAVPISEGSFSDYQIENFVDRAKDVYQCNIYNGKYYKEKGVKYWTANFGSKSSNTIKFKLNSEDYVEWAAVTHPMPKPTKNYLQEYKMDSLTAIKEVVAVTDSLAVHVMDIYDDKHFSEIFFNEIDSGLEKIIDQVSQGKAVTPYDHTSSVFVDEVGKTFNIRVYWSESQIFVAFTAK